MHGSGPSRRHPVAVLAWGLVAAMFAAPSVRAQPPAVNPLPPVPSKSTPPREGPGTPRPDDDLETEREISVTLRNSQTFTGMLVEQTEQQFVVRIGAIKTRFPVEDVERYRILPPVQDRYRELRLSIDDEDPDQVANLIEWLQARRQLGSAMAEAEAFLNRQPGNPTITRLRGLLDQQITLRRRAKPEDSSRPGEVRPLTTKPPATPAQAPPTGAAAPAPLDEPPVLDITWAPVLAPEQIALMRVYEVNLADNPRVEVPREVIQAIIDRYADNPLIPATREGRDQLFRQSGPEILRLLFRLRARDLYPMVRVLDQPVGVRRFRDEVFRAWVAQGCATSDCHGGSEAGRLILPSLRPGSDATVSTALYILQQYRTNQNEPLLNFDSPERSVLLEMALPRDESRRPHPPVLRPAPGGGPARDVFRSPFNSRDDRRVAAAVEWLKSMYQPRPEYELEYQPQRPFRAPAPDDPAADGGR